MLNLRQTWLHIADAYGAKERTDEQERLAESGICDAAWLLQGMEKISSPVRKEVNKVAMTAVVAMGSTAHLLDYLHETQTSEGDAIREAFCLKQAEMIGENDE